MPQLILWARTHGPAIAWGLAYAGLAVAITWPLAPNAADHLPKGNVPTAVPALAGTWALWWVSDRLGVGLQGLWQAPIFHPAPGAFALSETTLPLGLAAAPVFWGSGSPALAYNLVVGSCLILNGWTGRGLAADLGAGRWASGLAGALLVTTPLILRNLSVLPMVPLFGVLLFCRSVLRFAADPGAASGAKVGLALALALLLSAQYGLFLVICAPALALALRPRDPGSHLVGIVAGATVALALAGPVLLGQRRMQQPYALQRTEARAEAGAATFEKNWLNAPQTARFPMPDPAHRKGAGLYPGTLILIAAGAGLAARRRDRRVWAIAATTAGGVALSVLPTVELAGIRPYLWLRDVVPGLALIRETRRAGAIAIALVPVLAGVGLGRIGRRLGPIPGAAVVGLSIAAYWPDPHRLQPAPDHAAWADLHRELVRIVPDDGAVAFLPFVHPDSPTPEADRMVLQADHGLPMVNGYSSYYPESYWSLRQALKRSPTEGGLVLLREAGVTHVIAPPEWMGATVEAVWVDADLAQGIYDLADLLPSD